jgi:endonuclease-3
LNRAEEILARLLDQYERHWRPRSADPFRSLVRIILSQNTNYKNEVMAFDRLEKAIGITPENIAESPVKAIADAIRPAGLYHQRSRNLKRVAQAVIERYKGDLNPILNKPYTEARDELMQLSGVGPKTADVLLLFEAGKCIIPVDRHIFRITKRLQLVSDKAAYDEVRNTIEDATPPGRYEDVHVLLIRFGREICKAQRPRCLQCFLRDLCPYPDEFS